MRFLHRIVMRVSSKSTFSRQMEDQMDLLVEKPRNCCENEGSADIVWKWIAHTALNGKNCVDRLVEREYSSLHISSRKSITSNVGAPQDKPFAEIGSALSENPGYEIWGSCNTSKSKVPNCLITGSTREQQGAAKSSGSSHFRTLPPFWALVYRRINLHDSVTEREQNWAGKLYSAVVNNN